MPRVHKYFRVLYLGGVQTFIINFDVRGLQGYPLCAIAFFLHFLKGFSKEIDHLSLVDFLHSRTFQARFGVWRFTASSSKSFEGFRKGLRKGSTRKGIEKQI